MRRAFAPVLNPAKIYVETGHLRERVRLRSIIEQIRIGKSPQETDILKLLSHDNKARRVFHGKRTQSERIHNAKNRGVSADAERKSQHDYKSESRILAERSEGVTQILQERVEEIYAACLTAFFFGAVDSTEFQACAAHRFMATYAVADQVLGVAFHVETQFRIHFGLQTGALQRRAHPGTKTAPEHHISSRVAPKIPAMTPAIRFHFSASACNLRLPVAVSR
jgi:hypothetical protein